MRNFFIAALAATFVFTSCNKDKYTSAPQIKFKSITSPYLSNSPAEVKPILIIELSDAEGDFGFEDGKDTSYVYVKNLKTPLQLDSFKFPAALSKAVKKNFKGDIELQLNGDGVSAPNVLPSSPPPGKTDTVFYEIYVKDFAKNKSNLIKTEAFLFKTP